MREFCRECVGIDRMYQRRVRELEVQVDRLIVALTHEVGFRERLQQQVEGAKKLLDTWLDGTETSQTIDQTSDWLEEVNSAD